MCHKTQRVIGIVVLIVLCTFCKNSNQCEVESAFNRKEILLPKDALHRAKCKFTGVTRLITWQELPFQGYISEEPNISCFLDAKVSGFISKIFYYNGQYVKAGSIVAQIESSEGLLLQKHYLEALYKVAFCKEEYVRQGELTLENATSIKKMSEAKYEFLSAELNLQSLQLQLKRLGLNPDSIRNGNLQSEIPVIVEKSGFLHEMKMNTGMYFHTGDPLAQIRANTQMSLNLEISSQYLKNLKKGQIIKFFTIHDSASIYQTYLLTLPEKIDPHSQNALLSCTIKAPKGVLYPGMAVKGRILALPKTSYKIPVSALIHSSKGDFVLAMSKEYLNMIPIQNKNRSGQFILISDFPPDCPLDSVITEGATELCKNFFPEIHPR